jgi:hypothetical protein
MIIGGIGVNWQMSHFIIQDFDLGLGNAVSDNCYIDQVLRPNVVTYFQRHLNHFLPWT